MSSDARVLKIKTISRKQYAEMLKIAETEIKLNKKLAKGQYFTSLDVANCDYYYKDGFISCGIYANGQYFKKRLLLEFTKTSDKEYGLVFLDDHSITELNCGCMRALRDYLYSIGANDYYL